MKQEFFRLVRHDRSLFKEPMKRWFRMFGLDFDVEPTRCAGGNQGLSDPESSEVIELPGESVIRGKSPDRAPAPVNPYEGQLDPELVRDVFTPAITPTEHSTAPENQPNVVNLTIGTDQEEADGEDGSTPKSPETAHEEAVEVSLEEPGTEAGSPQPPPDNPNSGSNAGEEDGRDASSDSASTSKLPVEAPPTTMVRTMVETISDRDPGVEQSLDLLPDGLEELFIRNARVNVGVKTLLLNLEPVDIWELTGELKDFAESIGAISRPA